MERENSYEDYDTSEEKEEEDFKAEKDKFLNNNDETFEEN